MTTPAREPVSRRGLAPRPALSRDAIVSAGLRIADSQGLDAVTMRRVAASLDTSASALYVYVRSREDLADAMFDHVLASAAEAVIPEGTWRERLAWLLAKSAQAASGHGGLAKVAFAEVPDGPNARKITGRVRELLSEGQIPEEVVPAALDLLGLLVTAMTLDRVPEKTSTPSQRRERLHWEIEVVLNGLAASRQP
jgi:AcrR family transcriptional regulator